MAKMKQNKLSFNRSIIWILGSTLLISGSSAMAWLYFLQMKDKRLNDDQYRIVAIVQSSDRPEALKTSFLAEILELSMDRPVNLYRFNLKDAERKLQSCPLVKKASIKKILPGTLYIHYKLRRPCAILGDCANTAIDKKGNLFPFKPFFTPKNLPVLYLDERHKDDLNWGRALNEQQLDLFLDLSRNFLQLNFEHFMVTQIDLSHVQDESCGQRQIVIVLKEINAGSVSSESRKIYIRLDVEHYKQGIKNFYQLFQKYFRGSNRDVKQVIVDLRLSHLAFIKNEKYT